MGLLACVKFVWPRHAKVSSALTMQSKCDAWKAIFTIEMGSIGCNIPKKYKKHNMSMILSKPSPKGLACCLRVKFHSFNQCQMST